jgi:hypothetical protein
MARLTNGINGPLKGKVGSVIASSMNGVEYLKGQHKKRTKKVSKKELGNRKKFTATQAWLKPLLHFLRDGYKNYSPTVYGFVAAKSYLHKNALRQDETGFDILPELMKVSYGTLPLSNNLQVKQLNEKELEFTWDTTCPQGADPDDQVMLLAYNDIDHLAFFTTTGQFRKTGKDTLSIEGKAGQRFHVYMAFSAADRLRQSDSVYLGEIVV